IGRLVASPASALPFLRERLRPVPRTGAARITRLITDLDSDDFAVRDTATHELESLEEQAAPALKKVLQSRSPEVRRRAEALLEVLEAPIPPPKRMQFLRAIEAVEHLGGPEAKELLHKLADGAPEARLTQEA